MNLYEVFIPQAIKMLENLDAIMAKGETFATEKKFETEVLVNSRLAPDQFPFKRQVQIACDTAKLCASRMSAIDAPVHNDSEQTFADLRNRITDTVKFLKTIDKEKFNQGIERQISQPRWEGKYLTGFDYVSEHAIPNLYFHITTAYAILRHNGVEVGKKDYLGNLPFKMQ